MELQFKEADQASVNPQSHTFRSNSTRPNNFALGLNYEKKASYSLPYHMRLRSSESKTTGCLKSLRRDVERGQFQWDTQWSRTLNDGRWKPRASNGHLILSTKGQFHSSVVVARNAYPNVLLHPSSNYIRHIYPPFYFPT